MSWRWPAPDQAVWFPVLTLTVTVRSGAGQDCNVFVRSAVGHRLASHKPAASQTLVRGYPHTSQRLTNQKPAASQPLVRGWLPTNWWPVNKVLVEKPF